MSIERQKPEHDWAQGHLAAHVTGGLTVEEGARLTGHLAACAACAADHAETRLLDDAVTSLFAGARPTSGLEDRVIRAIREERGRTIRPWFGRIGLAAAAACLMGFLGHQLQNNAPWGFGPFAENRRQDETSELERYREKSDASGQTRLPSAGDLAKNLGNREIAKVFTGPLPGGAPAGPSENIRASLAGGARYKDDSQSRAKSAGGYVGDSYAYGAGAPAGAFALTSPASEAAGEKRGAAELLDDDGPGDRSKEMSKKPASGPPPTKETSGLRPYLLVTDAAPPPARPASPGYFKPGEGDFRKDTASAPEKTILNGEIEIGLLAAGPDSPAEKPKPSGPGPGDASGAGPPKADPKPAIGRKIIKTGEMEFEIESFDSTLDRVAKIAEEEGGLIAGVNSEKLPNGKVRGEVVIRCPPENLGTLILKLRALGELKRQKVGSEDVTKRYTDIESQLRALRAMEDRLLTLIATGKGEMKEVREVEKDLGECRTKIETLMGEMKYFDNLISLSTLTLTLYEKEIKSPFEITESERVEMGIEAENVPGAYDKAHTLILDQAKGRITKADLRKLDAGQFTAEIEAEVPRQAAGPLRDELQKIGHVARLDVQRARKAEGGTGRPSTDRLKQDDTVFAIRIYNLTNVEPRETVSLFLACLDVEEAYTAILKTIGDAKEKGRLVSKNLTAPKPEQATATVHFELMDPALGDAALNQVKGLGEVLNLRFNVNPDAANVSSQKRGFVCQLVSLAAIAPRETADLTLAAEDVPKAYRDLLAAVAGARGGRLMGGSLNERDPSNVTAQIEFETLRESETAIEKALKDAGVVYTRATGRNPDLANTVDRKIKRRVSLVGLSGIPPREALTLGIEVSNVDAAAARFTAAVSGKGGRIKDSRFSREATGRVVAHIVAEVPLKEKDAIADAAKDLGTVRVFEASKDPRVPEEKAMARFDLTLSNKDLIIPSDQGFMAQIRAGLGKSFHGAAWSLQLVIVGTLFVLPWALAIYVVYRIVRRVGGRSASV